jgi:indole-3-glycerol phosphate synthase
MAEQRPEILTKILIHKAAEVAERIQRVPLSQMQEWAKEGDAKRPFEAMLRAAKSANKPGVIAEIKRASPSKGILREDFDPMAIARSYQFGGATCLSVLTDNEFFKGGGAVLELARKACSLPALRKDFIIDPYQIYESRVLGADCLLLIVSALDDTQLNELYALAKEQMLDVLIEVHDEQEMQRALSLNPTMIGVNNRNLHSFEVDLDITLRLHQMVPSDCLLVTESGIHTPEDIQKMQNNDINTFLVGEAFMRVPDPGQKLKELFFADRPY